MEILINQSLNFFYEIGGAALFFLNGVIENINGMTFPFDLF